MYGIVGIVTHVLATEDSVSMISEAATAGFCTGVLPVEHEKVSKESWKRGELSYVERKILTPKEAFGIP